ncbi:dihydrofolate reductase family protein [Alteribacter aurantiacus]|uniref:dihydrofolate reductase family protein n=1 Tax=Alteribacter aurantiacus TaxID=254410 RepID=UPI00042740A6|nr:dihydrofolate reductase family protein [Alteribacter aurantiacus]
MNREVVLYIACSLDGYIAREDGEIDWLTSLDAPDTGYEAFYRTIDTVVMGRKTYDDIFTLADEYPYQGKMGYVYSRSKTGRDENVTFVNEDLASFVKGLKAKEGKNIWIVGGSGVITPLMKEAMIDRLIVTYAPVALGGGVPLFPQGLEQRFSLQKSDRYGPFVQMEYKLCRTL